MLKALVVVLHLEAELVQSVAVATVGAAAACRWGFCLGNSGWDASQVEAASEAAVVAQERLVQGAAGSRRTLEDELLYWRGRDLPTATWIGLQRR
jgi:hypothetical protein